MFHLFKHKSYSTYNKTNFDIIRELKQRLYESIIYNNFEYDLIITLRDNEIIAGYYNPYIKNKSNWLWPPIELKKDSDIIKFIRFISIRITKNCTIHWQENQHSSQRIWKPKVILNDITK